jgi:ATP-binding cassette subfamily B protein
MLGALISHYRSLLESLTYAETLFEFLTTETFAGACAALPPPAAALAHPGLTAIRLENVSYTYPETGTTALLAISYAFTPGLTAIVGTNGVGKSTLVKLLSGLIVPTTGSIQAIGVAGAAQSLDVYAKAVLFQDPAHFHFSIRHNVTMQFERRAGEEERIAAALRQAGLWEVVQSLPEGIDTVVGAGFGGATDLSGGQWQRLALARLLYHDAPLIILDEPSASLDPVGERQIFDLLTTLAHEKIIIFTTHRYDTIRKADTIVVLVDGRIAESGTHDELERNAGDFWSLYLAQGTHPLA